MKFIRSREGMWVNIKHIRSFYIGGDDECGYRICFSYEFHTNPVGKFMCFGKDHPNKEECQKELDLLMTNDW
jgi:hypothetical protein